MAENNEPSLDDIVAALTKLSKDDLEKLYKAVVVEGRKKGSRLAGRSAIQAGSRRPRY
jgi:hypothetical protein